MRKTKYNITRAL